MITDYHVHTSFSNDSKCPMETIAARAVSLGLDEICITEHLDCFQSREDHLVDYDGFFREISRLNQNYGSQLIIKAGGEFGVQIEQTDRFCSIFSQHPFDFILLSNHEINDLEFWNGQYQMGKEQRRYNRDYYEAILNVTRIYKDYSVLAHLDMIKRYDSAGILADHENEELIREILKTIISDGKGIEVNSSSFRYQIPDLTPSKEILSWYLELGGHILTFGSDTHKADDLADSMTKVMDEVKKLGFREFCTFSKMKPIFHLL